MWRRRERVWQGEGSGILLRDLDSTSKEEVCPHTWIFFPTPHPENPSKHVVPTSIMFANVPQQWVSSSQLAASAQPDPFLVPASWHTPWARVPFPDTCAPSISICTGLSPQPISLLPSNYPDTLSDLYMCRLWLSVIPGTPQTASHPFSLLLGLFITRESRIPFSKCLLIT